jgi:hypothetical protein
MGPRILECISGEFDTLSARPCSRVSSTLFILSVSELISFQQLERTRVASICSNRKREPAWAQY